MEHRESYLAQFPEAGNARYTFSVRTPTLGLLSLLLCAPIAAQAPQGNEAAQRIQDQVFKARMAKQENDPVFRPGGGLPTADTAAGD